MEEDLQRLVEDFLTQKQILLVQLKKGILSKEQFLREVLKHIEQNYHLPVEKQADLLKEFEQYVFGYSRLSSLMDDGSISDIRVVSHAFGSRERGNVWMQALPSLPRRNIGSLLII